MEENVRIDKWLWAVRIFKTRSQATDACRSGKVKSGGQVVKPSHEIRLGETITITLSPITKSVKVVGISAKRVGAVRVPLLMEDLTPKEEYDKLKTPKEDHFEFRPRGFGRPTKRERRNIEQLKKYLGLNS